MNQQENQERANQAVKIEDLPVEISAQLEVKGGPVSNPTGSVTFHLNHTY